MIEGNGGCRPAGRRERSSAPGLHAERPFAREEVLAMSFSEDLSKLVADQLARFVTLNPHQLAGHAANLDFWLDQARHALGVIDGYEARFRQLKSGQEAYVAEHRTTIHFRGDPDVKGSPPPPRRVPDTARREARLAVTESTYRFLIRCYQDGLIPEPRLRAACDGLDLSIDPHDLRCARG
jgi:hypothetical protein